MSRNLTSPSSSLKSADAADKSRLETPPVLFLEICCGQTRFPQRPIGAGRYLIGSGSGCDLMLGGTEVPPLHSIMHTTGREIWLERVVASPPLKVNAKFVEAIRLKAGDLVEIGPFQFRMRAANSQTGDVFSRSGSETPSRQAHKATPEIPSDLRKLEALSASTLVDLIELEQNLVGRAEARQALGAEALLHAALERADSTTEKTLGAVQAALSRLSAAKRPAGKGAGDQISSPEPQDGEADVEFLQELERIAGQLDGYSRELDQRAERLASREAVYAKAAGTLLDTQQKLATHLEDLLNHVQSLETRKSPSSRAVA